MKVVNHYGMAIVYRILTCVFAVLMSTSMYFAVPFAVSAIFVFCIAVMMTNRFKLNDKWMLTGLLSHLYILSIFFVGDKILWNAVICVCIAIMDSSILIFTTWRHVKAIPFSTALDKNGFKYFMINATAVQLLYLVDVLVLLIGWDNFLFIALGLPLCVIAVYGLFRREIFLFFQKEYTIATKKGKQIRKPIYILELLCALAATVLAFVFTESSVELVSGAVTGNVDVNFFVLAAIIVLAVPSLWVNRKFALIFRRRTGEREQITESR